MPTPDRLPQPPGPPTLASILADHEREKRRQQRPVSKSTGAQSARGSTYHRFTHSGVITLDEPSAPFVPPSDTRLVGARCDVAAGSDDATVGVYIDGSLVDSVSWSSAPTAVAVDFDEMLTADSSRLTVAFTAASGSASVSIRFEMSL